MSRFRYWFIILRDTVRQEPEAFFFGLVIAPGVAILVCWWAYHFLPVYQ